MIRQSGRRGGKGSGWSLIRWSIHWWFVCILFSLIERTRTNRESIAFLYSIFHFLRRSVGGPNVSVSVCIPIGFFLFLSWVTIIIIQAGVRREEKEKRKKKWDGALADILTAWKIDSWRWWLTELGGVHERMNGVMISERKKKSWWLGTPFHFIECVQSVNRLRVQTAFFSY